MLVRSFVELMQIVLLLVAVVRLVIYIGVRVLGNRVTVGTPLWKLGQASYQNTLLLVLIAMLLGVAQTVLP